MTAWTLRDGQGAEKSDASGMSSGFTLPIVVFTSKLVNANIYQELLRQHVVPWVQRDVVWQKIRLLADSVPASATQMTLRPLAEFCLLADWPPYSPDLNSLDLSHAFCSQKARPHLTLIWAPYVRPSLWNGPG